MKWKKSRFETFGWKELKKSEEHLKAIEDVLRKENILKEECNSRPVTWDELDMVEGVIEPLPKIVNEPQPKKISL